MIEILAAIFALAGLGALVDKVLNPPQSRYNPARQHGDYDDDDGGGPGNRPDDPDYNCTGVCIVYRHSAPATGRYQDEIDARTAIVRAHDQELADAERRWEEERNADVGRWIDETSRRAAPEITEDERLEVFERYFRE